MQQSCRNPLLFYVFLLLLLGVKQQSCETPIVFVLFPIIFIFIFIIICIIIIIIIITIIIIIIIIIIILPLESMAAHRTPWLKVVKFGTLIQDSPISPHSKFKVASP